MNIRFSIEYKTVWGEELVLCTEAGRIRMSYSDGGIWTAEAEVPSSGMTYHYEVKRGGETVRREWYSHILEKSDLRAELRDSWISKPTEDRSRRMAGTAVPVFSLRTEDDFGVGEFQDIRLLVDWAVKTGQSIIQLLPINDTTMAGTWQDSYPYNANTTFALHPMYINLPKAGLKVDEEYRSLQKKLNSLQKIDYVLVNSEKNRLMHRIFDETFASVSRTKAYRTFISRNESWLMPYAAFRALGDIYGTPEFGKWGEYAVYDEKKISSFIAKHKKEIDFHCFVQYHLDLQLSDAVAYAHRNNVVLKGDLPIGISRTSVDAWLYPGLFNMDSQAGAPPDAFAEDGQNWGFPTYNWDEMAKDGFAWWKSRLRKMSEYFDAFRIDHILGFFRIWEIPADCPYGLLGYFNPALPYSSDELLQMGFDMGEKRYSVPAEDAGVRDVLFIEDPRRKGYWHPRISAGNTKVYQTLTPAQKDTFNWLHEDFFYRRHTDFWWQSAMKKLPGLLGSTTMLACGEDLGMIPACVPDVMDRLGILSLEIQRMPKTFGVEFDDPQRYPYMCVCTTSTHDMTPIRAWWTEDRKITESFYKNMLGGEGDAPEVCPVGICEQIIRQHLESPAMFTILPLQDWLAIDSDLRYANPDEERINVPAESRHYWRYRLHLTLETLLAAQDYDERLRTMVAESGRVR